MKILFLFPYPVGHAASQRFRFEQYLSALSEANFEYSLAPFLNEKSWKILYRKGHLAIKFIALIKGFLKRLVVLFTLNKYDFVFIHREALPIGPPILEWIIAKVFRKRIIYDFDDAIWISNSSESNRFFAPLKTHSNVFSICRFSYKISVGNEYLANMVRKYNQNVIVNPTTIDTGYHIEKKWNQKEMKLTIGWTGSHSTNKYLEDVYGVIDNLKKKYEFNFLVISDEKPSNSIEKLTFLKWNKKNEIEDLSQIDIGIMPLKHDPWSEGKCGFKALQYMALGIPALVSPVGVNQKIVDDGINGYICDSESDWYERLAFLLENFNQIQTLGKAGREKVISQYSVISNTPNFIHLFT